jgi:hypothetical protein
MESRTARSFRFNRRSRRNVDLQDTVYNESCCICCENASRYTILCRCSNQYICLKCVENLEKHKNYACPFCRRQLNRQMITDYNTRMKRVIYVILSFCLMLFTEYIGPILFLSYMNEPKNTEQIGKVFNKRDVMITLLTFCFFVMKPVNHMFIYYYMKIPFNHNYHKNFVNFILIYTVIFYMCLFAAPDDDRNMYMFFFHIFPCYIVYFLLGICIMVYELINYFIDTMKMKYYFSIKIIPVKYVFNLNVENRDMVITRTRRSIDSSSESNRASSTESNHISETESNLITSSTESRNNSGSSTDLPTQNNITRTRSRTLSSARSNEQENNDRRTRYLSNETTYHPGGIYDESLNINYEEHVFNDTFSDDDVIYNSMLEC